MVSAALQQWQGKRGERLDNLESAHRAISGAGPGRRWVTTEVNHALIVRLASEFQGFCRDLHDEALEAFLGAKFPGDAGAATIVEATFRRGRRLDTGNASWTNVCDDFRRLGAEVATDMKASFRRYPTWVAKMELLNRSRNAIAHDDQPTLTVCLDEAPLTLSTFRDWRSALRQVTGGLDKVVGAYLTQANGTPPW